MRKVITLILFTLCSNSFAYNCAGLSNDVFDSIYDVSTYSHQEVLVKNKKHPEILNKVILVGTEFQGRKDESNNIKYTLNSIKDNKAEFGYIYIYDARSVGGSFAKCSGLVTIELSLLN